MLDHLYNLLQRAAANHGDRPAIDMPAGPGPAIVSYRRLLERSDRLSSLLVEQGARPGARVAFCYRKSADALEALFAVIRTGATYVPVDPAWPAERIDAICTDAGTRLWLGSNPPPDGVSGIARAVVSAASGETALAQESAQSRPAPGTEPAYPADDVANILYTSGSTGRPKGVQITMESLLHFSRWAADYFELTPDDRVANHAPYNFDLSTFDVFAAVRAGATMCPVPEATRPFPYQMARYIADAGISVWYSVPSALVMMQLRGGMAEHDWSRLRHVIFAGEVMAKPALRAIARAAPRAALTNLYGPTETNVCTRHRVTESDLADDRPLPIGRPITDTRVWIMDAGGAATPDGEPGELWVAGPTVTSGYFGDPPPAGGPVGQVPPAVDLETGLDGAGAPSRCAARGGGPTLTARRLRPAPDGLGMAYRTGDRVSRRPDGVLMFHGRLDRMIKCRGHRVEPGEIEAVLCRHPAVREAAVVPVADAVFGARVRACVALDVALSCGATDLAAHCRDRLPSYMCPDEWTIVESLPRTERGKIDYAVLA